MTSETQSEQALGTQNMLAVHLNRPLGDLDGEGSVLLSTSKAKSPLPAPSTSAGKHPHAVSALEAPANMNSPPLGLRDANQSAWRDVRAERRARSPLLDPAIVTKPGKADKQAKRKDSPRAKRDMVVPEILIEGCKYDEEKDKATKPKRRISLLGVANKAFAKDEQQQAEPLHTAENSEQTLRQDESSLPQGGATVDGKKKGRWRSRTKKKQEKVVKTKEKEIKTKMKQEQVDGGSGADCSKELGHADPDTASKEQLISLQVIDEGSKSASKMKTKIKPPKPNTNPEITVTTEAQHHHSNSVDVNMGKNGISKQDKNIAKEEPEIVVIADDPESEIRRTSLEVSDNMSNELKVASQSKKSGKSFLKAIRKLKRSTDSDTNTDTENESEREEQKEEDGGLAARERAIEELEQDADFTCVISEREEQKEEDGELAARERAIEELEQDADLTCVISEREEQKEEDGELAARERAIEALEQDADLTCVISEREEQKEEDGELAARERAIEALEQDAEFMGEFEAMVSRRRERRHKKGAHSRGLLGPHHAESGTATPSSSRSRSRSHSRQVADPHLIRENLRLQKEVIACVRQQPLHISKKLKTVRLAKSYIMRYEGNLSRSQGYQEAGFKFWLRFKREFLNFIVFFIPWEMRIKLIESHFGSVVASYFTFLRWLFWFNILLTIVTGAFIITPEVLAGEEFGSSERKSLPEDDTQKALNLDTVWNFEGYLKVSVLFYGYYGNEESLGKSHYRLPLAYLLTGGATFALSFIVILRKMAVNARLNKWSMADEQFTFTHKAFSTWDFMIGHVETAKNKVAEITTSFRESILEEQERTRSENKYLLLALRGLANILVTIVLASSTYAIYVVVEKSSAVDRRVLRGESVSWLEQNMVAVVTSIITAIFPSVFEVIGMMEKYHPRLTLRWQLARILVLYLLNLYTLVVALYWKIRDRTDLIEERLANITQIYICPNVTQTHGVTFSSNDGCVTSGVNERSAEDVICWETELGQEMFKLTMFDLVITAVTIVLIDCVRGLGVRHFNACCCWDLERKFPEYGEFKLAENILHLINNQAMVWLGTFYAPALPGLNVIKLLVMVYMRSWAVLMCNIPHERIFKASRSNNFYLALLLLMLFLVTVLFIFLTIQLPPSPDCGPFSDYERAYHVLTEWMEETFPDWLNSVFDYIASPGVILPLFLLLVLSIFYLISLTSSLKEANKDLRKQLVNERSEDRQKHGPEDDQDTAKANGISPSADPMTSAAKFASMTSVVSALQLTNRAFKKKDKSLSEETFEPLNVIEEEQEKPKTRSFAKLGRLIKFAKWTSKKKDLNSEQTASEAGASTNELLP